MKENKKVVIVDALHDSDRGGAGILSGVINSLHEIEEEEISFEIDVVYRYSEEDHRFESADRHISSEYPDIQTHGQTIKTAMSDSGVRKYIDFGLITLWSVLVLLLPNISDRSSITALREADYVISKGGHFYQFRGLDPVRGFFMSYHKMYSLLLAIRLGKPYMLLSHSIGPFEDASSKRVAQLVFDHAELVSARDIISKRMMEQMGLSNSEILPDTGFGLIPATDQQLSNLMNRYDLNEGKYLIMSARQWHFPEHESSVQDGLYGNYLASLAEVADRMIEQDIIEKVALVVHNDGGHSPTEDDSVPINNIYSLMKHSDDAVVIDDDLSPSMQSGLYGNSKLMIGTRMHSVIFTFVGGAPALSISYAHKCEGIMAMLGLSRYTVEIADIDPDTVENKVKEIISNRDDIIQQSTNRIEIFRSQMQNAVKRLTTYNLTK